MTGTGLRRRPASRQQRSYGNHPIIKESITKQKLMSGRKIVGSAAEGLISILYCESQWAVSGSPPAPCEEWLPGIEEGHRGSAGPDREGVHKVRETGSQRQAWCSVRTGRGKGSEGATLKTRSSEGAKFKFNGTASSAYGVTTFLKRRLCVSSVTLGP